MSPAYAVEIVGTKRGFPTKYDIRVEGPASESHIVTRRFNDFVQLRESLLADSPTAELPPLPPKDATSNLWASSRNARLRGLESFLGACVEQLANRSQPQGIPAPLETFLGVTLPEAVPVSTPESLATPAAASSSTATAYTVPATADGASALTANVGSTLAEVREMRRRRWLEAQDSSDPSQAVASSSPAAAVADSASSPAPVSAGAHSSTTAQVALANAAAAPAPSVALSQLCLLPLVELPPALDSSSSRLELLGEPLRRLRTEGTVVAPGRLLSGASATAGSTPLRFVVARCTPETGFITQDTAFFVDGPAMPRLTRVQFRCLSRPRSRQNTDQVLFAEVVRPHFQALARDPSSCNVVSVGDYPHFGMDLFHVDAVEPSDMGIGIVDEDTEVFARYDEVGEFQRIHVVPFADTLPSAYTFDIFNDYVKPFFAARRVDRFVENQHFYHNGVHFKIVAAQPAGPCRVGAGTEVFSEGRLHPTAADLLPPDQARQLALLPPGLQMLLLRTDMFGNGDMADRLMEAQATRRRNRSSELPLALEPEQPWGEELRARCHQSECIICLTDFVDGEGVRHLPCDHVFHTACIEEWLGRDAHCPLCRYNLRPSRRGSRRG